MAAFRTEDRLFDSRVDFSGTFLTVQSLSGQADSPCENLRPQMMKALAFLLESVRFDTQKQAMFLYLEAGRTLLKLARRSGFDTCTQWVRFLQDLLDQCSGKKRRALAKALSELPLAMPEPVRVPEALPNTVTTSLPDLLGKVFCKPFPKGRWQGRSLVFTDTRTQTVLVLKFARNRSDIEGLCQEVFWMKRLSGCLPEETMDCHIPVPLVLKKSPLFEVSNTLPSGFGRLLQEKICVAFETIPSYFEYPNEADASATLTDCQVLEIFSRNARIAGFLAAKGIVHTALIPLFHNRVQQERRQDFGIYLWEHGGRLDRWLDSCRFPNFGGSGLRDFEHFTCLSDSRKLGHYLGEHLLSFILVMGSYFRCKDTALRRRAHETPIPDARGLFDRALFVKMMRQVVNNYLAGLTGNVNETDRQDGLESLVDALIEKMGVDEDMEEWLRVPDQEAMEDAAFQQFLEERQVADTKAFEKGARDIRLFTGPHLGGFNRPISVPELIDFLFAFSARGISDRFLSENALIPCLN